METTETDYSGRYVNLKCTSQYLFRKFKKQFVNQVRVLDDDRHLDEQVVMGHLQVLDALRREVAGLVKLDGHGGQTVCFEAQEALACLGSVWKESGVEFTEPSRLGFTKLYCRKFTFE